jgi:hypothetical protein
MTANDVASGLAIMLLAGLSLSWRMGWARLAKASVGLWLKAAPWMLEGGSGLADAAGVLSGALLVVREIPRGRIRCRYGEWNRYIF